MTSSTAKKLMENHYFADDAEIGALPDLPCMSQLLNGTFPQKVCSLVEHC